MAPPPQVALSRAVSIDGLCVKAFDAARVKISYDAKRFHEAVSAASEQRSAKPMAAFWARSHFWWKDVLEGPRTHAEWADVYRSYGRHEKEEGKDGALGPLAGGTSFGSEFWRWEHAYPVPENLRRLPPS
jgi:hypothetical protein